MFKVGIGENGLCFYEKKLLMLMNTSSHLLGSDARIISFMSMTFSSVITSDKCCLPEAAKIFSLAGIRTSTLCFPIASTVQAFSTIALNIFLPGICRQCREKHDKTEEAEGASPCGKQEQVG